LVSIIVPTYNEEADIARTMDALAAQTYRPLEVVVVDASRDRTPVIVGSYEGRVPGLRLVPQGDKPGVSVARNIGLREARGEVVVILNADVFPDPDFVERIVPHFERGADYLLIDSRVANDGVFPRYLRARHSYFAARGQAELGEELYWTEGYSCRREAALAVGGFPEEFGRNTAGEDAIFGRRMAERFKRATDFSIVVPHVAPNAWPEFWRQRLGRGRGGAYRLHAYEKRPIRWGAALRATLGTWAQAGLILPVLIYAWRLIPHSPRGLLDWLPFAWVHAVDRTAVALGYWQACREIARKARQA
jgi:glycosyltransferase involved in cell wall biosynthesis